MKPSFGIVVACYNSERFIPRLVESLKAQTYRDFDAVFVDDCSTDHTIGTIAVKLAFTSWERIRLEGRNDYVRGDYGICYSFNTGAKRVLGTYLWFVHADTWLEPDCLQKMADYIERTGCKFLTARELRYDSDQDIHAPLAPHGAYALDLFGNPVDPPAPEWREEIQPNGLPSYSRTLNAGLYGGNLNCFERDLFNRIGGFDEHMQICCDEQDNGWRVAIAGEKAGYAYEARIHHWLKEQKSLRDFETHRVYKCVVNQMWYILKDAQHFLLLMFPAYAALTLAQSLAFAVLCRKPELPWWLWLRPLLVTARSLPVLLKARAQVRRYRVHGDWWFFRRFIYKGYGQWPLVKKLVRKVINEYRRTEVPV